MRAHLFGDAARGRRFRRLAALGLLAPRLREHCSSPRDPRVSALLLGRLIELTLVHTVEHTNWLDTAFEKPPNVPVELRRSPASRQRGIDRTGDRESVASDP
jgi:hypothetical protein